jgi:SAM-dependent methyltransferase
VTDADSAAGQIVGLYERHAHAWDAARGRRGMERAWLDAFASRVPPGAAVLDLGCGAGEPMAADLVGRGFRVTGVDAAPTLIGLCRARFPEQEWIEGDMRTLSLGRRFGGVMAGDSFFHLSMDGQRRMFPVFAEHAAPGAALMFTSGPSAGEALGEFQGEPLYHASLDPEEYRSLLAAHGFAVVRHVVDDPECGDHTIWLARHEP